MAWFDHHEVFLHKNIFDQPIGESHDIARSYSMEMGWAAPMAA